MRVTPGDLAHHLHLPSSSQLGLPRQGGRLGWPGQVFLNGARWREAGAQPPGHHPLPQPCQAGLGLAPALPPTPPESLPLPSFQEAPSPPGHFSWAPAPLSPPRFASDTGGACLIVGSPAPEQLGGLGWQLWGAGALLGSRGAGGVGGGHTLGVGRAVTRARPGQRRCREGHGGVGAAEQCAAGRGRYSCPPLPAPQPSAALLLGDGGRASAAHRSGGACPQRPRRDPHSPHTETSGHGGLPATACPASWGHRWPGHRTRPSPSPQEQAGVRAGPHYCKFFPPTLLQSAGSGRKRAPRDLSLSGPASAWPNC